MIILVWELTSANVSIIFLAPPTQVFPLLFNIWYYADILPHISITGFEILVSFGLATSTGLSVGFMLGTWKLLRTTYEPLLAALYAVPSVVWYPLLLLFLGLDVASKIAFAYILSFFPIVLSTIQGVSQVDVVLVKAAYSMGASKLTTFYKVIIPAALPIILSGISTGLALCVTGVIVGEMLGGIRGLGVLIASAATRFETARYFVLTILVIIIAFAVNYCGKIIERLGGRGA
ncbi:MAG: ABC transporter permease subunit [Nitrososphaerales archaeon]